MFELIIFYAFAAILLAAAIGVVSVRNPVHAALLLVLTFFTTAGIWLLLEAEFLAITLVLVYVGAVMVLFLFVVMMLNINIKRAREGFFRYLPLGVLVAVVMAMQIAAVVSVRHFGSEQYPIPPRADAEFSNTAYLGELLYTEYLLHFELAALILLVAIVAAIMLTMRSRRSKFQSASRQVDVRREDRVRLVRMPSQDNDKDSGSS